MDKIKILEILDDWNYWTKKPPATVNRETYDDKIARYMNKDEVVVIKGVRRCGKSTLMINQIKRLLKNGVSVNNILFVNLEDPRFINHLSLELLEEIKELYLEVLNPDSKPYIFLDEVQNVPFWEKWVNKEYELKLSFITLSGSNSSLLSSEISSALSGRYISVMVYPLSFKEYLSFKEIQIISQLDLVSKKTEINRAFSAYINDGGFPKILEYESLEKRELLISYKDSILLKDIVARFKLKNFTVLEDIAAFVLANSPLIQSTNKLKNNFSISYDMARDYLDYLQKAYMIFAIKKFDYSLKKQNVNDKKYFTIDVGLSHIFRVANREFYGADLENIVFLELLRRGFKLYYYKTDNNLEIDFIVEKDRKIIELIQVSKSLKEDRTLKRELLPFERTCQELQLDDVHRLVITEDISRVVGDVNVINIKEWLLTLSESDR